MDNFDIVTGKSFNRATGDQSVEQTTSIPVRNESKPVPLQDLSDEKLQSLKKNYEIRLSHAKTETRKNLIKLKIKAVDDEIMRREKKSSEEQEVTPEKIHQKAKMVGTNVGIAAVVMGVTGYFIGTSLNKNGLVWGLGGAIIGGAIVLSVQNKETT